MDIDNIFEVNQEMEREPGCRCMSCERPISETFLVYQKKPGGEYFIDVDDNVRQYELERRIEDCLNAFQGIENPLEWMKQNHKLLNEYKILKKDWKRIMRLPTLDTARASAMIMQVAAQLSKMSEHTKAKILQQAVDLWRTYTTKIEAENEKLTEKK